MTDLSPVVATFNRGIVSKLVLPRVDIPRVSVSAEIQTNCISRVLGSMSFRPGLQFLGECDGDGALWPFVYSSTDTAILELTAGKMRVWDQGTSLLSRNNINTVISNSDFLTDLADWTDADDAGCTSSWSSGKMQLLGTGFLSARRRQTVNMTLGDESVDFGLRIVVSRGPVLLRIGSTAGDDDVFRQAVLRTGTHSLQVNAAGNSSIVIEFSSSLRYPVLVDSCTIESGGAVELPTAWSTTAICKEVRYAQVNDIVYAAHPGSSPKQIERRGTCCWSIVDYRPNDGPFSLVNTDNLSVTPSALTGAVTVTAARPLFRPEHVGSLMEISSEGQNVSAALGASSTYSDSIRIFGVGQTRYFTISITGTWSGSITLERSIGQEGAWTPMATYVINRTPFTYTDDNLDNVVVYYRIGFASGAHSSGTANVNMDYASGSITGTVLLETYTSSTSMSGVVLKALGRVSSSQFWALGSWSDDLGWPSAVAQWQGRVWWFKRGEVYGSVSDAYSSFNLSVEGDSGPVIKPFGVGSTNDPIWASGKDRLLVGTDDAEYDIRSTAFREVVSPANYNVSPFSEEGCLNIPIADMRKKIAFAERSGSRIYEAEYDGGVDQVVVSELNTLWPEAFEGAAPVRMAAQRKPDERLHVVRSDGTVALLTRDKAEEVTAWMEIETDGVIEDVVSLPESNRREDNVFYRVRRTVNGATVRYLERLALETEAQGGVNNKIADSFITGSGPITGLDHLEGKTVVIWGDSDDRGTGVVSSGSVSGHSYDNWCVGLSYEGRFKSGRLGGIVNKRMALVEESRVDSLGFILFNTHYSGLQFGPSFDVMDDLPLVEDEYSVLPIVYPEITGDYVEFPGDFTNDSRVCLRMQAPKPCTISAMAIKMQKSA